MQTETPTTRAKAGKALLIFVIIMALLTLFGNTLQNMVVPIVSVTSPQRGSLEQQINASGTLQASSIVPVMMPAAGRVKEIYVKIGAKVNAGDPLLLIDYTDTLTTLHKTLTDALSTMASNQQTYDWAVVDAGASAIRTLDARRSALTAAEAARDAAQQALDALGDKADPADLAVAQANLRLAQADVAAKKASLDALSSTRSYLQAANNVDAAKTALDAAANAYFDLVDRLDGATPADRAARVDAALKALQYSGNADASIPYDANAAHLSTLAAEVTGEVTAISATAGVSSGTDQPVLQIGDMSQGTTVTITVSSDQAALVDVGDTATVYVGTDQLDCPVISKALTSGSTDTYDIQFSVAPGYGSIGLRADIRFRKRSASYDVLIPLTALRSDNNGNFVYVIQQSNSSLGSSMTVQRVDVYVVDQDNTRAALQGGVSQRDVLVLRSDRTIADGDRVRLSQ